MKKIIAYFRDGKFEELLGCLMIVTVIVPVVLNIINRSVLNKYSIRLWLRRLSVPQGCPCGCKIHREQDAPQGAGVL